MLKNFEKVYSKSSELFFFENGFDKFVEDKKGLRDFLKSQEEVLKSFISKKVDKKYLENFYLSTDIPFAIVIRFLKFFIKEWRKTELFEEDIIDEIFNTVSKVYIKKSIDFLDGEKEEKVLENLLLYKVKQKWIEQIKKAIEKDDMSLFPLVGAQKCDFNRYLHYPQSILICSEAASCSHLDELHNSMHKFAAEFYYFYTHKRYTQAYIIFRDLIATYLQFSNLLAEFYFLSYADIEKSFFSLVQYFNNNTDLDTYVILIDYHNLKRLNTLYGEGNITEGMKSIEKELEKLTKKEPQNYFYIKGSTADYYLLVLDKDESEVKRCIKELYKKTNQTLTLNNQEIAYTAYISAIKMSKEYSLSREDITKMLLQLREMAKKDKKGMVEAFSEEERKKIYSWLLKKYQNTKYLEQKISKKEFELVFQPIISAKTNKYYAIETLIRIKEKDKLVPAFVFIDLIMELDLVVKLDLIVLELLEKKLNLIKKVTNTVFINTSFESLMDSEYVTKLCDLMKKSKEQGIEIVVELTEQQLITQTSMIKDLKTREFYFAVDDFGSGYTSIKTVADLAFEKTIAFLKIDGSLIKDIAYNHHLQQIVKAINDIAKTFNLYTVAEFVENKETVQLLNEIGIDLLQGYFMQKPVTIEMLLAETMKDGSTALNSKVG